MNSIRRLVLLGSLMISLLGTTMAARFTVRLEPGASKQTLEGRVYVIVSRNKDSEPRAQLGDYTDAPPFWGLNATLKPGQSVTIADQPGLRGYPLATLKALPPGRYFVQAFLNVYTTFKRGDGATVKLHLPCGDGHNPFASPGNVYSKVRSLEVSASSNVVLRLDQVIKPDPPVPAGGSCQQGNPKDTTHLKHLKLKSALLTKFWGREMFVGADVLLPRDYADNPDQRYPVVYVHGHFSGDGAVMGFTEPPATGAKDERSDFSKWWLTDAAPRAILVSFRHENPFFDSSYAVNSANVGPYGDVIAKELVPLVDSSFRTIPERWARRLTGESTGGWQAMAQMIFYPDLYGGVIADAPDPLDFHNFELVDVYKDKNAYFNTSDGGWVVAARPSTRKRNGDTITTNQQENLWELALGTSTRSGLGNWDIWQATYSPRGPDGYPAPIWNKETGVIDPKVAQAWKAFDLREVVVKNWASLSSKLTGRMEISVGDNDNYFLNNGVIGFEAGLKSLAPFPELTVNYVRGAGHGSGFYSEEKLIETLTDRIAEQAPEGADLSWH